MDADLEQQEEDGKITKNKDIIINLPRIVAFNCPLERVPTVPLFHQVVRMVASCFLASSLELSALYYISNQ